MTASQRPLVKVASPSFSKNLELGRELRAAFPDAILNESGVRFAKQDLIDYLKDADAAIVGLENVDVAVLDNCPKLKAIAKFGVGLDNIDLEACQERSIRIGWTPGVNRLSVAEMTVAFLISLSRNLFATSVQLRDGSWDKRGGHQLSGKTVGIIGVGNVGKEVIRLLEPFRCTILVNDIVDQDSYYDDHGLRAATKDEIFASADFISVHTPLTERTRYLVNDAAFAAMKPSAYLINTARGDIVRQDALKEALKKDMIAGAAIDVYTAEPPDDADFLRLPNLICTPHIGGNAYEAVIAMGQSAIRHLSEQFPE